MIIDFENEEEILPLLTHYMIIYLKIQNTIENYYE